MANLGIEIQFTPDQSVTGEDIVAALGNDPAYQLAPGERHPTQTIIVVDSHVLPTAVRAAVERVRGIEGVAGAHVVARRRAGGWTEFDLSAEIADDDEEELDAGGFREVIIDPHAGPAI